MSTDRLADKPPIQFSARALSNKEAAADHEGGNPGADNVDMQTVVAMLKQLSCVGQKPAGTLQHSRPKSALTRAG